MAISSNCGGSGRGERAGGGGVSTDLLEEMVVPEPLHEKEDVGAEVMSRVPEPVLSDREGQVPRVVAEPQQASAAGPHLGQPGGRRGQRVRGAAETRGSVQRGQDTLFSNTAVREYC